MKKLLLILAAVMMVLPQAHAGEKNEKSNELKVMSFNIRYGTAEDGTNSWNYRYAATYEMLKDEAPDVFGLQEALDFQIRYIDEFCGYNTVGVGRIDGKKEGEHMAICWNKKTVKMIKWGTFWLSETPEKPSFGWDAACERTATWALMKCKKAGKKFYFVNTHLDHVGVEARMKGLQLIVDRIDDINPDGYPMVLTGDFNMTPDHKAMEGIDAVMQSARKVAPKTDSHITYNGWGRAGTVIDYVYISGFSSCPEFHTVIKKYNDRKYVSDHYPVAATLIF